MRIKNVILFVSLFVSFFFFAFSGKGIVYASHVLLGELDRESETDDAKPILIRIEKIIIHPNFNGSAYDDIALIKLSSWIDYNEYIRPACLYVSDIVSVERGIVSGWGRINQNGVFETHLQQLEFQFNSNECDEMFSKNHKLKRGIVNNNQICAKPVSVDHDACAVSIFKFDMHFIFVFCLSSSGGNEYIHITYDISRALLAVLCKL